MTEINYGLILVIAFFAVASPGPATLAIANTSMAHGRRAGALMALGISTGGFIWSSAAALGITTALSAHASVFQTVKILGAGYLLFLSYKATRSAFKGAETAPALITTSQSKRFYWHGLAIHLTNPKPILFFTALYAVAVPAHSTLVDMLRLNGLILFQGFLVFQLYAYVFSIGKVRAAYFKFSGWFQTFFALAFGFAGLKILSLEVD